MPTTRLLDLFSVDLEGSALAPSTRHIHLSLVAAHFAFEAFWIDV